MSAVKRADMHCIYPRVIYDRSTSIDRSRSAKSDVIDFCLFVFIFGEGLSLCQLGLCAEDSFVFVLNEKESCAFDCA